MNKAVVLVSGGMDSLVTAAIAAKENELAFLHINYGQRTLNKELTAFNKIADYYNVSNRLIIDMDYFIKIGGSSLTDISIPVSESNTNTKTNEIPTSYVSFRNANFLSAAVSWAEIINANKIFIGAVEEDSSGYPDCRKIFFNYFNFAVKYGTKPDSDIEILTPVIDMTKANIVKLGMELKVPFELSWSCYKNNELACGKCDSCILRLKAFRQAGYEDPIKYETIINF